MKKVITTVLLILGAINAASAQTQTATREQSNLEKFSAKSGTLIEQQFVDVGSVKQVKIQLLVITDMMVRTKTSGVRMEYVASSRYSTDTKITFLDLDEVDGLIKSINILNGRVFDERCLYRDCFSQPKRVRSRGLF